MKILILTDSRGFCPSETKNWVHKFCQINIDHNIIKKTWNSGRISTIFEQVINVKKDNKIYDLIILQSGFHDYVFPWPKRMFKFKLKGADPNYENHLLQVKENKYIYRNDNLIRKHFKILKKYTKNILFVSLHFYNENCFEPSLYMNNLYGLNVDNFILPMHKGWRKIYTSEDNIHYCNNGADFICKFVDKYIKRVNKTIIDYI